MSLIYSIAKYATISGTAGGVSSGFLATCLLKSPFNHDSDLGNCSFICTMWALYGGTLGIIVGSLYGVADYFNESQNSDDNLLTGTYHHYL